MHFFVGDIVFDNYANILLKRCINCTFSYLVHLTEDTVALNTLPLCLKKKKPQKKPFCIFMDHFCTSGETKIGDHTVPAIAYI